VVAAGYAPVAAAPPAVLYGNSLQVIPTEEVTYRVRETHVKTGGLLPGEYEIRLKLGLWVDRRELKLRQEEYEGTPIVPVAARITDFSYQATRAGGERHELDGGQMRLSGRWGFLGENARFRGQWDTSRRRFRFGDFDLSRPSPRGDHLAGVWVPALIVDFPEYLKLEEGFSWGQVHEQAPRRLERLSYLQQWKVASVEKIDGDYRLTLAAECKAEPDEQGQRAVLKREIVYDTQRQLVRHATVAFETSGGAESETIKLTMELEEERQQ
jgi:hypothetical protein